MAGSSAQRQAVFRRHIRTGDHAASDYFAAIRELLDAGDREGVDQVYALLRQQILENPGRPETPVKFGTSGWRGILGRDLFQRSAAFVTLAIIALYEDADQDAELRTALGVSGIGEAHRRGAVVGHDNRFAGSDLARAVSNVLLDHGFTVLHAGEATTGALSALVLEEEAAFSINLTPSHNPLDYGGFKYNAADAGPAPPELTSRITARARQLIEANDSSLLPQDLQAPLEGRVRRVSALEAWKSLFVKGAAVHGLDYGDILGRFAARDDIYVVVDSVHGASRLDIESLFAGMDRSLPVQGLRRLRSSADVTFGGIAPEPSTANMAGVREALAADSRRLKIGAIIDPDGDRIRFTDGTTEISMNHFGAMAYHFLHEHKGKKGMVAKTVATSNLANAVARALGEEVFEPAVGFKNFKPVLGKALVFFEESDGISIIGHTPEKDAYVGLMLALDMVMSLDMNLGDYLERIEEEFGAYHPARDGLPVSQQGEELHQALAALERYGVGASLRVGDARRRITEVITIDGRKMVFEDRSWIMIRPSGTEPKVRFYVEARRPEDTRALVDTAKSLLRETGLI